MRILLIFGLIVCGIFFLQTDASAQRSKTKCPPRAKGWKGKQRTELVKFPALIKNDRQREKAERRMGFTHMPKEKKVKEIDKRENYYVNSREPKVKVQKMAGKQGSSTDCPR